MAGPKLFQSLLNSYFIRGRRMLADEFDRRESAATDSTKTLQSADRAARQSG